MVDPHTTGTCWSHDRYTNVKGKNVMALTTLDSLFQIGEPIAPLHHGGAEGRLDASLIFESGIHRLAVCELVRREVSRSPEV